MAKFSSLIIASHQSAMNFSSLMYAFPMSVSTAMAIVVSYEVGAKRLVDAKKYIKIGRLSAMAFAILTLSFLYVFRENVASLYGHDPEFVQLTASFMTYSLFFQLADTFCGTITRDFYEATKILSSLSTLVSLDTGELLYLLVCF